MDRKWRKKQITDAPKQQQKTLAFDERQKIVCSKNIKEVNVQS